LSSPEARQDEPVTKPQRTPSRDVEGSLVRAADLVLRRDGMAGVTVRAVAAEAGVAPMGVYSRFGSKDGLVDVLLVRGFDGLRAAVAPAGEVDADERLRAAGVRYRGYALANREYYEAMFVASRAGPASAEVAEHACAAFGELVGHVEYGMAAGTIRAGDATETAQRIWSAVHGAVALELNGLVLTPDAEQTFLGVLDVVAVGLAAD
jgi:AcrR family transcriptional regulator